MTKEIFNFTQYNIQFYKDYSFLFTNKEVPSANLHAYLMCCGYKPDVKPLLSLANNIGHYSLEMLLKYESQFIFLTGGDKDLGSLYQVAFHIGENFHLWGHIVNLPEDKEGTKEPRYLVSPILASLNFNDILSFIDENESFKIKPQDKKGVGFGNFH